MNNLVIDLTHGGVKIAISLAKAGKSVLAYDIYGTLNDIDRRMLEIYSVELIGLDQLKEFRGKMKVISPIHLPLSHEEIESYNPDLDYTFITHHEAILEILEGWGEDIPKVEITGVKGKTSCAFMLKEILLGENPLILSSLGALLYEDSRELILKKNISITPANIKETIDLAYKVANPICKIAEGEVESENLRKYSSAIFESSLGVTGIGDVGLLTNISENYPIAKNRLTAAEAKRQVFRCGCVAINKESLDEYYKDVEHPKVNTFSLDDSKANLYAENVSYSLDESVIDIIYRDVKTIDDSSLNGKIRIKTFAPGPHHVSNVLGVVLTSLSLNIDEDRIVRGLANYKGITGRTNKRSEDGIWIIEEINPGINTDAIKQSINMIPDLENCYVSLGGDYGITCEEIDEDKVVKYLNTLDCKIILTGDVGRSISQKMSENIEYIENPSDVYEKARTDSKNLLFIYRSDYSKVSLR